jgi:hypothetical protein
VSTGSRVRLRSWLLDLSWLKVLSCRPDEPAVPDDDPRIEALRDTDVGVAVDRNRVRPHDQVLALKLDLEWPRFGKRRALGHVGISAVDERLQWGDSPLSDHIVAVLKLGTVVSEQRELTG